MKFQRICRIQEKLEVREGSTDLYCIAWLAPEDSGALPSTRGCPWPFLKCWVYGQDGSTDLYCIAWLAPEEPGARPSRTKMAQTTSTKIAQITSTKMAETTSTRIAQITSTKMAQTTSTTSKMAQTISTSWSTRHAPLRPLPSSASAYFILPIW